MNPPQATVAVPSATATRAPQEPPTPSASSTPDNAALKDIEAQVAVLRGLRPTEDVPLAHMDRDALRQFLLDGYNREYSAEERDADQRLYEALGLLQPDENLAELLVNLFTSQVAGLYDQETKTMYLVAAQANSPDDKVTFAHEYTHALQDQHFDLSALAPEDEDNADRSMAIRGLIEGDAVLTMVIWAQDNLTFAEIQALGESEGEDELADTPPFLRDALLFPYTSGFLFVQTLYARGGYAALDEALRDPPASTEQVLHPEKYEAREAPREVRLPPLTPSLGAEWSELSSGVVGEFELRSLLPPPEAESAAAGWGGDRVSVLSNGDDTALVLRTVWDTPADAAEFYDAYLAALETRFRAEGRLIASDPNRHFVASDDYAIFTERFSEEVLILIGTDESVVQRLQGAFGG